MEKELEELLELAINLASTYHKGQKDKTGHIYILHPLRVMENVTTVKEKIVAVLHDIVEDTNITLEYLIVLGFHNDIIQAINCLTRDKSINYFDYVKNIKNNTLAKTVKKADLMDNMRDGCPKNLLKRYKKALEILKD